MLKDYALSILRVAFTLWILFYHSVNEYFLDNPFDILPRHDLEFTKGITNLVLYGFMWISGLLAAKGFISGKTKYRNKRVFISGKIKRILVPYIFWALLLMMLYPVSIEQFANGAKHLWFLLCLFDLMVIAAFTMPILMNTSRSADIMILIGILMLDIVAKITNFPGFFGISSAIHYLPAFAIGIFTAKYKLANKLIKVPKCKLMLMGGGNSHRCKLYGSNSCIAIGYAIYEPATIFGTSFHLCNDCQICESSADCRDCS